MARNPFAGLLADLCHARSLEYVVDVPEDEMAGEWWVEIIHRTPGHTACAEVSYSFPTYGYGLYDGENDGYGQKPKKTTYNQREAVDWVCEQLGLERAPAYPTEDNLEPDERAAVDPYMPLIRLLAANVYASTTPYADAHFAARIMDGEYDSCTEILGLRDGLWIALENGWEFPKVRPDKVYTKAGGGSVE